MVVWLVDGPNGRRLIEDKRVVDGLLVWQRPDGSPPWTAAPYVQESTVTGLVEALEWVRSYVDETAPEEDGLRRVVEGALSSYKQEVGVVPKLEAQQQIETLSERLKEVERQREEERARYRREKKLKKKALGAKRHWKHNHNRQVRRVRQVAEELKATENARSYLARSREDRITRLTFAERKLEKVRAEATRRLETSEADPEVPRCGASGKISVGVNEDFDTGALEADDEKDCPGCPDCQSTPELRGEEKSGDEEKAVDVLRRFMCCKAGEQFVDEKLLRPFGFALNPEPYVRNLAEATDFDAQLEDLASLIRPGGPRPDFDAVADGLERIATRLKQLTPASTQPVSESPGDSGESRRMTALHPADSPQVLSVEEVRLLLDAAAGEARADWAGFEALTRRLSDFAEEADRG